MADDKRGGAPGHGRSDYQPNIFSRAIRRRTVHDHRRADPKISAAHSTMPFLRSILQGLDGGGYSAIFTDGRWARASEEEALRTMLGRQVDGIIVVGGYSDGATLAKVAAAGAAHRGRGARSRNWPVAVSADNFPGRLRCYMLSAGERPPAHRPHRGRPRP